MKHPLPKKNTFSTTRTTPIESGRSMTNNINRTHQAVGSAKKRLRETRGCTLFPSRPKK